MKSLRKVVIGIVSLSIVGCVTEIKNERELASPFITTPRWTPHDTPNKATLQRLWDQLEEVRADRVPVHKFIEECETRLKNDESLQKEKKDVAVIYFWCASAAMHGKQPSLVLEYHLKNIKLLERATHNEKNLQMAEAYYELSWTYLGMNEIDKSIEAAKVVIEKFPNERVYSRSSPYAQPTIRRFNPITKTVETIPDTSSTRKQYSVPRSPHIATFAVQLLARVYTESHREDEGIQYFRQLRRQYPNEIGYIALLHEGFLQFQKKNFPEVKAIKQQLLSEINKYPEYRYRVESTLQRWDRIERGLVK